MQKSPPAPPDIKPRIKISVEQWAGLLMLTGVITAGVVQDLESAATITGRIAVIYVFLTVAFRLIGKRELSTLSPLELITLMLMPEIASGTLTNEGPLLQALMGISVLLALVFVVSLLGARFKTVEKLIEQQPRVLVVDGALCTEAMFNERITPDELFSEMHKHGIEDIGDVKWAILESGGDISFVPKHQPLPADSPEHQRTL